MKCRLAATMLLAVFAVAQDKPTMEQTAKWLATKIAEGGSPYTIKVTGVVVDESTAYRDVAIQDCKLTYTVINPPRATRNGLSHIQSVMTVPLARVKEGDIAVWHIKAENNGDVGMSGERWIVAIGTPVLDMVMTDTKEGAVVTDKAAVFHNERDTIEFGNSPSTDEDTANRVQKALKYAVSLCRESGKH